MGDIKRIRKKYETPRHPWNRERIDAERVQKRDYGLRNKKEIWKFESLLKGFKDQIKAFPSMEPAQAQFQEQKLRERLKRLGIVTDDTPLGEVLGYGVEVMLDRRLQTIVFKRGLARTPKQARQLISHEHITVGERTVNAPSYIVTKDEESTIAFHPSSPLFRDDHPERMQPEEQRAHRKKHVQADEDPQPEVVELTEEDKDIE